jgi:predicted MFS family arabinose efflux permease
VVQLRAAAALRGRIVSFFFVALGVIYPIGALAQGALADRVGLHAITVGAALAMLGVLALLAAALPSMVKSLQGGATGRATEPTTVVP